MGGLCGAGTISGHDRRCGGRGRRARASLGEDGHRALLREARSLSRRADKLTAAVPDPTTAQLSAQACATLEQLVHHLMLLERQLQRGENSTARRR